MAEDKPTLADVAPELAVVASATADARAVSNVAAAVEATVAPAEPKIDAQGRSYATGKRKDAVARVWVKPGSGVITVNGKEMDVYFARPVLRMLIRQPFDLTERGSGLVDAVRLVMTPAPKFT